jgi:hypothetical protein
MSTSDQNLRVTAAPANDPAITVNNPATRGTHKSRCLCRLSRFRATGKGYGVGTPPEPHVVACAHPSISDGLGTVGLVGGLPGHARGSTGCQPLDPELPEVSATIRICPERPTEAAQWRPAHHVECSQVLAGERLIRRYAFSVEGERLSYHDTEDGIMRLRSSSGCEIGFPHGVGRRATASVWLLPVVTQPWSEGPPTSVPRRLGRCRPGAPTNELWSPAWAKGRELLR